MSASGVQARVDTVIADCRVLPLRVAVVKKGALYLRAVPFVFTIRGSLWRHRHAGLSAK